MGLFCIGLFMKLFFNNQIHLLVFFLNRFLKKKNKKRQDLFVSRVDLSLGFFNERNVALDSDTLDPDLSGHGGTAHGFFRRGTQPNRRCNNNFWHMHDHLVGEWSCQGVLDMIVQRCASVAAASSPGYFKF